MTGRIRLRRIVRTDISGPETESHVQGIHWLAQTLGADVEAILITDTSDDYPLLFALLDCSGVSAIVVPDATHLSGWLPILRAQVQVWTLRPLRAHGVAS